jgi:hypothetical protein
MVRLQGLGQLKNQMTSGIKPATFRNMAYRKNKEKTGSKN